MILIDQPFVSDFLISTIKDNNYEVVSTRQAKELVSGEAINWISEETAAAAMLNGVKVYTNSENSIAWIIQNLKQARLSGQIRVFKDKYKFRELIRDIFPDFFYKNVRLEDIKNPSFEGINFPFVIKPSLGFFSAGVRIVRDRAEWETVKQEMEYENLQKIYPKEVLDTSTYIIEEFIEGEEYAIDCYYNDEGEAVILNILHHKFSSGADVSDRVYSTSKDIIFKHKKAIKDFLTLIGLKAGLTNFPMHVEIRIDSTGIIRPIEVNPLRFGGWCTTGDLTWYAFGFNSYEYFFANRKPNWDEIFKNRNDKIYSIIVLNNNSGYKVSEISYFDFDLFTQDFENVLDLRKLDIKKYPVFGFVFTETSFDNEEELDNILISDLRKYISIQNR